MKVKIAERHARLSDALKGHILEKTNSLERYFDRIISADVVLGVEKERQIADFHLHLVNKKVINAHEESSDMYASIDGAVDHLKRQLVEFNDRIKDKHQEEVSRIETETTDGNEQEEPEIIRTDTYFPKPMGTDEAVLQLEAVDKDFLVFVDADTDEVAIIYHRRDGNYGLIEPRR